MSRPPKFTRPTRATCDVSAMRPMPARCASCPFNAGADASLRASVEARAFSASQVCHHPRLHGKEETHLCRGSRDHQLTLFHRLGWIDAPTDAAWDAASQAAANTQPQPETITHATT